MVVKSKSTSGRVHAFVDAVMERVRREVDARTLKLLQGQVGAPTDTGLQVFIEGTSYDVQWKASGLSLSDGDIVLMITGPAIPLTILFKRVKTI